MSTRSRISPPPVSLGDLARRLRRHALKLTGPRQAILEILCRQARPVAAKEIRAALGSHRCDLATIYRAMRQLEASGIVRRYDLGDRVARYQVVSEGDQSHHHHLVCTGCANVQEIPECFPAEIEKNIARRSGFAGVTHRLEFFGRCPECQRGAVRK